MTTLLLTSLVGVALVGLVAYWTTTTSYDRLRLDQAKTTFVSTVTSYYQDHQGWGGIETWLRESQPSPGTPGNFAPPQFFALADAQGVIVVGSGPFHTSQSITSQQLEQGTPIEINGKHVGTVLLAAPPPALDPRERDYLQSTNRALLIGAMGASLVALLIGLLLSRRFLHPLTELTKAITAMRRGDLNQQVEVRSHDELGDLAQTFNQMSTEINRANQLRKQMTADIAHDLRTPLLVITGYIEALRDGTLQPTAERLEAMSQEALLLKRLIEDLRTLSLTDAGELKLLCQTIQPRDLLEQVRQSFEPIATEQQIALHIEAGEELPSLEIDRERMVQVLANLVNNALRYTPAGGAVTLAARQNREGVQLVVSDNGSGIPEDKLPNIFERFYCTEEARSRGESGLGLAIAKSIVDAHHGTITAESRVRVGTSITITLPPINCVSG